MYILLLSVGCISDSFCRCTLGTPHTTHKFIYFHTVYRSRKSPNGGFFGH